MNYHVSSDSHMIDPVPSILCDALPTDPVSECDNKWSASRGSLAADQQYLKV